MYCYKKRDGEVIESPILPRNSYALAGFQNESDRGLLVIGIVGALTPLLDENGKQHRVESDKGGHRWTGQEWVNDRVLTVHTFYFTVHHFSES